MASVPNPLTDYERGLMNRGIPELTLKDVSVVNQYVPHLMAGTPEGDAPTIGKDFQGPAWLWEQVKARREYLAEWDRMLGTVSDIEGGPGGVVGFALDGARGAAAGAKLIDEPINSLDPHNPLNIHEGSTHLPSEVETSHVGAPVAGPAPESRREGSERRGADTTNEPPPASGTRASDEMRGLQNRLGVAPSDVQPPPPSKVKSSPGLAERQRRPGRPLSPSPSRGYIGSIEGPLRVLPSKRQVSTATRPKLLPPAVIPAMKAPPNRTTRPNIRSAVPPASHTIPVRSLKNATAPELDREGQALDKTFNHKLRGTNSIKSASPTAKRIQRGLPTLSANVEQKASTSRPVSTEEISDKIRTRKANEKAIRKLELQLQKKENRATRRNPDSVKSQIYDLRVENEQLFKEIDSMALARPNEPLGDLEHRWFRQWEAEPLDVYRERMAAKKGMVEDEALRDESRLKLADHYDELMRSLETRSRDLEKAKSKGMAAETEYEKLRREWRLAKQTASNAGEAFPRKSSKELFEKDLLLDDDYETAKRRLEDANRDVQRAQFSLTNTGDIAEKSIARDYLLDRGFENIRSVQNRSGHGIDIVATRKSDRKTIFFEVKGSETSRARGLSARQKDATSFVSGSIEDLSPKDAQELLEQIGSGKVEGYILEITDINLLAREGKVKKRPW